jgi:hypothetical protein
MEIFGDSDREILGHRLFNVNSFKRRISLKGRMKNKLMITFWTPNKATAAIGGDAKTIYPQAENSRFRSRVLPVCSGRPPPDQRKDHRFVGNQCQQRKGNFSLL